jgi:hypothetical protein
MVKPRYYLTEGAMGFRAVVLGGLVITWLSHCFIEALLADGVGTDADAVHRGGIYADAVNYDTPTDIVSDQRKRRNVVVFLLPAFGEALDGLPCSLPCSTVDKGFIITQISKIDSALKDNFETDIVVFHEGYPYAEDVAAIRNSSERTVDFVNIDKVFLRIPADLDPYLEQPTWSKRSKWRYHQMIRFMVTDIFR